jgi:UDP-N-acetylmuramoyl-L-alanyl-D-glutamate--2,6-diaminopimelate ligase
VEPDRHQAIQVALRAAGPGDVVVIAGKGHETTQTFASTVEPFDDAAVARDVLEMLMSENGMREAAERQIEIGPES